MIFDSNAPAVSIVAPCYNEADCLGEFHRRAAAAAQMNCDEAYEIVLVDDGSRDNTWDLIAGIATADPHVVGVRLMRNHGHQLAASAGLALARGQRVMLIDADLQDPPELLAPMMKLMDGGADVVFGQRGARHAESWFKKASASGFYRLLSRLAAVPIPRDTGDFRLMRRRVVDALVAMPERQRFIRGLVSWIGGRQVALVYERQARHAGSSKYPLRRMIRFAVDAITGFSIGPLRAATYLGLAAASLALLLMGYTLWQWVAGDTVAGWSSVMTAIVLFGAVQLIVLGIQGEYVGRLFQEAKARPLFLIDTVMAESTERALPMEFCTMAPRAQREIWDAVRSAKVAHAHGVPSGQAHASGTPGRGVLAAQPQRPGTVPEGQSP
jgi:glycosyltransferase involved in cell wall biosynthesis